MVRTCGRTYRISLMLTLVGIFCVVEIIVGYMTNSMSLVTDSFHKLSDGIALVIALIAAVMANKGHSPRNTYGWIRAEILAALVNAVFLIALCFSLFVESLQRLIDLEEIEDPVLIAAVGGGSLFINIVGVLLFVGYVHPLKTKFICRNEGNEAASPFIHPTKSYLEKMDAIDSETGEQSSLPASRQNSCDESVHLHDSDDEHHMSENAMMQLPRVATGTQLNMHGVFLHTLTDTLGSIVIISSALVIHYASGKWRLYMDPALSLVLMVIIAALALLLLKESAYILIQMVPHHIDISFLKTKLIKKFPELVAVHDFHVWRLEGDTIIATAHITIRNPQQYSAISRRVKKFFHDHGIHSTTIQPEFLHEDNLAHSKECILACGLKGSCDESRCCTDPAPKPTDSKTGESVYDSSDGLENQRALTLNLKRTKHGSYEVLQDIITVL